MYRGNSEKEILFEHRFWLQILGDHSRFIYNALSPVEEEEIDGARHFIETFDNLLDRVRKDSSQEGLMELTREIYKCVRELKAYKLNLLRQHLVGDIKINLSPTFFNHMLNELDEYLRILTCIMAEKPIQTHPVHYHLLWLLDGKGHAAAVEGTLDEVETKSIDKSREFSRDFRCLYIKAVEMAGYLRAGIDRFPALKRFNTEAELEMQLFMNFLKELEELRAGKEILGTLYTLMADHMYREECYYLTKLSEVADVEEPGCDPAKPRQE